MGPTKLWEVNFQFQLQIQLQFQLQISGDHRRGGEGLSPFTFTSYQLPPRLLSHTSFQPLTSEMQNPLNVPLESPRQPLDVPLDSPRQPLDVPLDSPPTAPRRSPRQSPTTPRRSPRQSPKGAFGALLVVSVKHNGVNVTGGLPCVGAQHSRFGSRGPPQDPIPLLHRFA